MTARIAKPPRSVPVFSALLCAAPIAWLVMMVTGVAASMATSSGQVAPTDELIIAFVVAMSLPFGLVIVAVYLPVVVAMRQASMVGLPTGLFALAGAVAAPVAGLLLLVLGHALFRGQPNVPGSLWQDLSRLFGPQFVLLIPPLVALMIGGAVFGAGFAQSCRYLERAFPEAEGLRNHTSGARSVKPDSY